MTLLPARTSRLARSALLVLVAVVLTLLYQLRPRPMVPAPNPQALQVPGEEYFSPETNLEQLDLARINAAKRTIDVAMYAFTDKYIAEALKAAARRGVVVRVYRDRQQYEDEQRNSAAHASPSSTDLFSGESNIHVRVKGKRELMHLKAYLIDGTLLRDGSANWSPSGLKRQDNNARFTSDSSQVRAFQEAFEQMWRREDNTDIQ